MPFRSIFLYTVIILAAIGFGSVLIDNPLSIIRYAFFVAISVGLFFLIYRVFMKRKPNFQQQRAYLQAAKFSKKRMKSKSAKSSIRQRPLRKRSDVKLTVIEGKKNKKKNRASL
ncbi:SA1362 family protein [Bacillus spongiae]|uniref:SA1362 family protein n=1 Tax=Bacillus spongiae TaxID=2683610 RepID=A0ABU8HGC5_9BACI